MQKQKVKQFSSLLLNLPDASSRPLCIGNLDQDLYVTHWDNVRLDENVCEFHGVIGQDKELIHLGYFVELAFAHYEEVLL